MKMSRFMVKMACDNAAFNDTAPEYEIARVLKHIVAKLEAGITEGSASDSNGNRVAQFKLSRR
jgi:hypothetical protein